MCYLILKALNDKVICLLHIDELSFFHYLSAFNLKSFCDCLLHLGFMFVEIFFFVCFFILFYCYGFLRHGMLFWESSDCLAYEFRHSQKGFLSCCNTLFFTIRKLEGWNWGSCNLFLPFLDSNVSVVRKWNSE